MMKLRAFLILALLCVSVHAYAQIPTTLGWYEVPNSAPINVCPSAGTYPDIQGEEGCSAVVEDWAGGVYDTTNNRLLFMGGGHAGYAGNEVYAFDLDTLATTRLNEPSSPVRDGCVNGGTYADGKPTSRHNYNHITYLPTQNAIFQHGGANWIQGCMGSDTWFFNLSNLTWTSKNTINTNAGFSFAAVYDPVNSLVYMRDDFRLYSYNPATNAWSTRSTDATPFGSGFKHGVLDPVRRKYYLMSVNSGTTLYWYDVTNATGNLTLQNGATTGCSGFIGDYEAAMEYDPIQHRIIGWNGGSTIYILNPDTLTCTTVTHNNGPGTDVNNGTFGRFRFAPDKGVFVLVNHMNQNVYTLRLSPPEDFDFYRRCNAAGVIKCQGFDNAADYVEQTPNFPADGPYGPGGGALTRLTRDTSTFASCYQSNCGSARFRVDNGVGGDNPSGSWQVSFPAVGNGDTVYIQFRQRFSASAIADLGGGGWKSIIVHHESASCAGVEVTMTNQSYRHVPILYTDCGGGLTDFDDGSDVILQYSVAYPPGGVGGADDYYCKYNNGNPLGLGGNKCAPYLADQWITYDLRITVGTFGSANSTIIGWVTYPGGTRKPFINRTNNNIPQNSPPVAGFNRLTLTNFMTNRGADPNTHSQADFWYDELVVSSQPIAVPGEANAGGGGSPPPTGQGMLQLELIRK